MRRTFRIELAGDRTPILIPSLGDEVYFVAISHSSGRIAYTREAIDWDIWRVKLSADIGNGARPFLSSTRTDSHAQYSPDGTKIVFESSRSGNSELWICDANGSNPVQLTSIGAP